MTGLDKLLNSYVPPPVPEGLAEHAATAASAHPQEPRQAGRAARRHDRRGGWKRPLWISAASFGLAFTSAVAATVASGGRIEIPVVQPVFQEVVEAVPVLQRAQASRAPERVAETEPTPPPATPEAKAVAPQPGEPGWRKAQVDRTFAGLKQQVEARRAAGLPTPRADRIDRTAEAIVARRQAKGLPAPDVDRVKAALALRELKHMREQRSGVASAIPPERLERIAERLSPNMRARFDQMTPEEQQAAVRRFQERRRQRRAMRAAEPVENSVADVAPSEGFSEPPR